MAQSSGRTGAQERMMQDHGQQEEVEENAALLVHPSSDFAGSNGGDLGQKAPAPLAAGSDLNDVTSWFAVQNPNGWSSRRRPVLLLLTGFLFGFLVAIGLVGMLGMAYPSTLAQQEPHQPQSQLPTPPYLAVLLHLGSLHLVPEFLTYFRHLDEARVRFDLLVSVTEGRLNPSDPQLEPLRLAYPSARIVPVPNHGMDIGGFLHLVPLVLQGEYTVVLKLHSKSRDWWRTEMLQPLIGTPEQARFNVGLFQRFPRVGLVGPARFHFPERAWSTAAGNVRHMIELAKQFGFPPITNGTGTEFIAGTTFFMRRAVLDCTFGGKDIRRWTEQLTPGGATGADGSVEHGWERFLGHMVQACGYGLQGTGMLRRDTNGRVTLDPQNQWSRASYVPVPVRNHLVDDPFGQEQQTIIRPRSDSS